MSQDTKSAEPSSAGRVPDVVRHDVTDDRPRGLFIGPMLGVVFAIGAVLAVGVSFLRGDTESIGAEQVAATAADQPVSLSVLHLDSNGNQRSSTIAVTVVAAPNIDDYGWVTPGDTVVGQPALRPSDSTDHAVFSWLPGGEIELGVWSSSVAVAEVVDASVVDVDAECALDREGTVAEHAVSVEVTPDRTSASGENVVRYTFSNSALRAGDEITCTFADVSADSQ